MASKDTVETKCPSCGASGKYGVHSGSCISGNEIIRRADPRALSPEEHHALLFAATSPNNSGSDTCDSTQPNALHPDHWGRNCNHTNIGSESERRVAEATKGDTFPDSFADKMRAVAGTVSPNGNANLAIRAALFDGATLLDESRVEIKRLREEIKNLKRAREIDTQ